MATTTNLTTLKINYLTQAQYDTAKAGGDINPDELYFTPSTSGAAFGSLETVGRSTLTAGYTPTSDGFLIISGMAASGQTPYVYVYGDFNGTTLNVFAQNAAAGGRVGACIPLKSGITYTWLYDSTTSHWSGSTLPVVDLCHSYNE